MVNLFIILVIFNKIIMIYIYKSFTSANRAFSKFYFKCVDLAILEVNDGETISDSNEVFHKF